MVRGMLDGIVDRVVQDCEPGGANTTENASNTEAVVTNADVTESPRVATVEALNDSTGSQNHVTITRVPSQVSVHMSDIRPH